MKKLLLLAIVAAIVFYLNRHPAEVAAEFVAPNATQASVSGGDAIGHAYAQQQSGIQVSGAGTVSRVLGDDSLGDRHQRFIVTLHSGQALLITHNIDIAPRIDLLREGDLVSFSGEYEWDDKGGIVHWTHHDPRGQHMAGWVKHRGRTYQ